MLNQNQTTRQLIVVVVAAATLMFLAAGWGLNSTLHAVNRNWTQVYGHFAHGYLVLAMAIWLAWRYWRQESVPLPAPGWAGLPLLAMLVVALSASMAISSDTLNQSLLPLMLLAAVATTFGWPIARLFFWPIAFLYTALPMWWLLNPYLQRASAVVANLLVKLTGIPAFVEGDRFHLPAGTMEVAAGCSGLSFLTTAIALALFQGLVFLKDWRARAKLLALAVVLGLVSNWLRIYFLMVVGYLSDMRHYLITVDHLTYGWVVFLVCMWPVFWYGARLELRSPMHQQPAPGRIADGRFQPWHVLWAAVCVAALLLIPRVSQWQLEKWVLNMPRQVALISAEPDTTNAWIYGDAVLVAGAAEERASFVVAGEPIWIYRASNRGGSPARWPSGGPEVLEPVWRQLGGTVQPDGRIGNLSYAQYHGELRGMEVMLRTGSLVAGHHVDSRSGARLATLRGFLDRRQDATLWMVSTPCKSDCLQATRRLDEWLAMNASLLGPP